LIELGSYLAICLQKAGRKVRTPPILPMARLVKGNS